MSIRAAVILNRKGRNVVTVAPQATLAEAVRLLAEHNIGALVVSADGETVDGMMSERDIVRCLGRSGGTCLAMPISSLMTREVITCGPEASIEDLMETMTARRIRHVPILEHGRLTGLVSIGDVVKARIDELEVQTISLTEYVTTSY